MKKREQATWYARAGAALAILAATTITLSAQTFTTLYSFDSYRGSSGGLVPATNGNLYGTTYSGGANGNGTVFKISPSGTLTTLYSFDGTDGDLLDAGLVQATDGNFYGTTYGGGANTTDCNLGCGTFFKITPQGTLTTLYSFCAQSNCADGAEPYARLTQAVDGNLYGTTAYGGANGDGTVFKITPSGTLTTLHSFDGTDGETPEAALVQATDGNFYGTTAFGGANEYYGTVFKITPAGTLTTLYSFCSLTNCADGWYPQAGLVQAANGNLYGTTYSGGANNNSLCDDGCGTIFKITPSGTLTTLYSLCSQTNCTDGYAPQEGLVQATDGNFYGTTELGGGHDDGTVFKITPSGTLTTLHSFDVPIGAFAAPSTLVQDTNGTFYGTTIYGGANDDGTVYSLSVGLASFVETQPTFGRVGKAVGILGTNLTGATNVTFNGTAAVFKVFSDSLIGATVPTGATSGKVQVVTPSGTLTSSVPFRVRH